MITIELTQGQVALVDDCDADLAELNWYAKLGSNSSKFYAAIAYNEAAIKHFGEFATLNEVTE